jgi:hypothetical protein
MEADPFSRRQGREAFSGFLGFEFLVDSPQFRNDSLQRNELPDLRILLQVRGGELLGILS